MSCGIEKDLSRSMNLTKTRASPTIFIHLTRSSRISNFCALRKLHNMRRKINHDFVLNETESKIKNLLVDFCGHFNQSASSQPLELRITGGWVRDKLLGKESNDLDIAVNILSGEDFASKLLAYASQNNIDLGKNATSLHTIKKNPDKSKHLETCTTKLYGLDIDFVNLRSEQYTEDSRVPIIECGTAEEDALRRDATLNALFYNLNKSEIEDLTGKGLEDLENGILRTPLQPLQTFLDDPLRVLRLVRFASRFNFVIDNDTLLAMRDERIRSTLIHKISRERVGVEIDKILASSNVQYGLRLINYVGLTDSIFSSGAISDTIEQINEQSVLEELEHRKHSAMSRIDASTQAFDAFRHYINTSGDIQFQSIVDEIFSSKASQKLFWLCTILQPYGNLKVKLNSKKLSLLSYVEVILKEGLRFGKHDYDTASSIVDKLVSSDVLHKLFQGPQQVPRSELGMYIRQFDNYFSINIVVNAFNDLLACLDVPHLLDTLPTPEGIDFHVDAELTEKISSRYESLLTTIKDYKLENVSTMKPIVDGKVISKALGRKPGPWMSKVTGEVLKWQLDHPEGTQDECIAYIRDVLEDL